LCIYYVLCCTSATEEVNMAHKNFTNNAVSNNASKIGHGMLSDQQTLKDRILSNDSVRIDSDQVNGMPRIVYNHAITKTALRKFVGGATKTFGEKFTKAVELGVIPEPIQSNTNFRYLLTQPEVHALLDHWNFPKYSVEVGNNRFPLKKCIVAIANQKGGVAKSTTTSSLAVATALDLHLRANVLILDLDPQGSMDQFTVHDPNNEIFLTLVDIIMGKDLEKNQFSELLDMADEKDIIQKSPFETHLCNLNVMPAHPMDERLTDEFWQASSEDRDKIFSRLRETILPALQEKYDVILIDTPPVDGPLTWLALEIADFLLTPIAPKEMDYSSTGSFLSALDRRYATLPSKGMNLKVHKMVLTDHDPKSTAEVNIKHRIVKSAQESLFGSHFVHSDAFVAASSKHRTVLDLSHAEGLCSKINLRKASESVQAVYSQFILAIRSI